MYLLYILTWLTALPVFALAQSTQGIEDLVKRRLPNYFDDFDFRFLEGQSASSASDAYKISSAADGKVLVEGNSLSALSSG